jgi:putative ABC transport system permease protein
LLVLAMIALPVGGLTAAGIVMDTVSPTGPEVATGELGTADVGIFDWDDSLPAAAVLERLPAADGTVRRSWDTRIYSEGSIQYVTVEDVDPADEVLGATYSLIEGRAPVAPHEIAVSPSILDAAHAGIGRVTSLDNVGNTYQVVGTVIKPEHLGLAAAIVAPGSLDAQPGAVVDGIFVRFRPGTSPRDVRGAMTSDNGIYGYRLRSDLIDEASVLSTDSITPFAVTMLVLAETGLIAAAAFLVGARRQTRVIGLIGAAGGEPNHSAIVVLGAGFVLGLLGSLAGTVLGVGAAVAFSPHLDEFAGRVTGPLQFSPWLLLGALALGTAAATLAAAAPARSAARVNVIHALAGRTSPPRPPARLARLGLMAVIGGSALTAWTVNTDNHLALGASLVVIVGGFLVMIPMLLGWAGRIATRLPLAIRLATRDAARHGRRTSPAIAAATVALMVPVAVVTLSLSAEAKENADPALAADQLIVEVGGEDAGTSQTRTQALLEHLERRVFPGAIPAPMSILRYSEAEYPLPPQLADRRDELPVFGEGVPQAVEEGLAGKIHVGDADLLKALHAETYVPQLEAGSAIVFAAEFIDDGVVHMHVPSPDQTLEWSYRDLPAVNATSGLFTADHLPGIVVSSQMAGELGLEPDPPVRFVVRAADEIDDQQLEDAKQLASAYPGAYIMGLEDTRSATGRPLRLAVLASSGLIALGIVAVAVALVAAETRRDRAILVAVGAAPGTRRRIAGSSALVLTGLAGLLAVPGGFLPAAVFRTASAAGDPLIVPWAVFAVVVLAVPLIAGGISAVASRPPPAARLLRPLG